jgi:hypothetical protein
MRRRPPRRRKACMKRELRPLAVEKNECWSMDFSLSRVIQYLPFRVIEKLPPCPCLGLFDLGLFDEPEVEENP